MNEIDELLEGELVKWTEGDAHKTGRVLRSSQGWFFVVVTAYRLVRESYTGRLVIVRTDALTPYPSEPIPEPTK